MSQAVPGAYKSTANTNLTKFYGQDKGPMKHSKMLGGNPNTEFENEEYISNLQQQLHFMELEQKILKEKVFEDEKTSGIGSLFDDEKTSHQHIVLLKQKYMQLRQDHEKHQQEAKKQKLKEVGERFVFESQIRTLDAQQKQLDENKDEFAHEFRKQKHELDDKQFKKANNDKLKLEADIAGASKEHEDLADESYKNEMYLQKNLDLGAAKAKHRYQRDKQHLEEYVAAKEEEFKKWEDKKNEEEQKFKSEQVMQELIAAEQKYKEEIEKGHVDLQYKQAQIQFHEEVAEILQKQKEDLQRQMKSTAEQNEQMEAQNKAKEEANQKRLIAKLLKDKNPHMKELIQKVEDNANNNEEFQKKLFEETEKHDTLLDELTNRRESYKLAKEKDEEVRQILDIQEKELEDRRVENTANDETVKEKLKKVEQMRKDNIFMDEKNRQYQKVNAALKAKLKFIEEKYDYTSAVKALSTSDFSDLIKAHTEINATMDGFKEKLSDVQKQIQQIEAERNLMS